MLCRSTFTSQGNAVMLISMYSIFLMNFGEELIAFFQMMYLYIFRLVQVDERAILSYIFMKH